MAFDPTFLNSAILVLVAFGGAFLAALWLALIVWTWRDIRARARDPLAQILAVLVVAVLTLLVGWAWRLAADQPLRDVVIRNAAGHIVGNGHSLMMR